MPKLSRTSVPSYRRHKASGQAVVTLDGQDIYLGKHNSVTSRAEYDRRIGEWIAAGRRLPIDPNAITIIEMVAAYRRFAKTYYRNADGTVSKATKNIDEALKPLLKLYGKTPAYEFGPLRLKAVRDAMVQAGNVRTNINRHVVRIRGSFKWAVENELIPPAVLHGLMAVPGLRRGRAGAVESDPVKPVPIEYVVAVLPHLSRQIAAMVQIQLLTGMRPGEVCAMRTCDIDTTGELWVYRPASHKTAHHGHGREVYLGPKAKSLLLPFLKLETTGHIFDPRDAERERRERLHAIRTTPLSCGNRPGTNRRRKPKRTPSEKYSVGAYYVAIRRACDKADAWGKGGLVVVDDERVVPRWHPHQLRHTAATELRKTHGVEAAQVILGHQTLSVTQLYAEKNVQSAKRIMAEVG